MIYGNGKFVEEKMELLDCMIGRGSWRDFEGKDGDYSFTIFLPKDLYETMWEEGWYVRHKPQYAGRDYEYTLEVHFRFDKYPPHITVKTYDGESVSITADNVNILQTADIETCDVVIRPYNWEKDGNKGVSAKLDSMDIQLRRPRRSMRASLGSYEEEEEE